MSLTNLIKKISSELQSRPLLAIFDRDGTLVPYHINPDKAIMPEPIRDLLQNLASQDKAKIGILSARDLKQLQQDFNTKNFILAGNYGMEILFPDKHTFVHPIAKSARPSLLKAKEVLQNNLPKDSLTILEDHGLTLCLHWHMTPVKLRESVHILIEETKNCFPGLQFKSLPTSYEIWPTIKWDKSFGLSQISKDLNLDLSQYLVMYVGDTEADEAAFDWINQHNGISLRIGTNVKSAAQFQIKLEELPSFLEELILLTKNV